MNDKNIFAVSRGLAGITAVAALIFALGGYLFYAREARSIRAEKFAELKAVADLKSAGLSAWRSERLGDSSAFSLNPINELLVRPFLEGGASADAGRDLSGWLDSLLKSYGYMDAALMDRKGRVRLSAGLDKPVIGPFERANIEDVLRSSRPVLTDLHRADERGLIHLDLYAPLLGRPAPVGGRRECVGVLMFRIDPERFLYPYIGAWPTPSRTAETLLVGREGGAVVFLNRPRHRREPPLAARFPLSRTELPAVQAVLGRTGPVEGTDYRGVPVIANARPVPDTPWFLVVKVDSDEILSELRYRGRIILILVLLGILMTAGSAALLQNIRQRRLYQQLARSNKARSESDEKLKLALRSANMGAWQWDIAADKRSFDDQTCRLLGLDPAAFGGGADEFFAAVHPDDREGLKAALSRVIERNIPYEPEYRVVWRDGSVHTVRARARLIRDEAGLPLKISGLLWDITEYDRLTKELLESETKYRTLFDSSQDALMTLFPPEWRFEACNAATLRLFGAKDEAQFTSVGPWVVSPERQPDGEASSVKAKRMIEAAMEKGAHFFEWTHKKIGGAAFPATVLLSRIKLGGKTGLQATVRDTSELKKTEAALRESENQYQALFEQARDSILLLDLTADGPPMIRNANTAALAMFGYTREELLGRPVSMLNEIVGDEASLRAPNKTTPGASFEIRRLRKDGSVFVAEASAREIMIGGKLMALSIERDITGRKKAEKEREEMNAKFLQSQKMESVGRLAGGVAHDFNNLLTAISGYAGFVLNGLPEGDPMREDVKEILSASDRATGVTRQLLAFSRKQILNPQVLDINSSVGGTVKMLKRLIGEDIRLETKLAAQACRVRVDAGQVDQVLVNLAVNARDAMPKGGTLTLETTLTTPEADFLFRHPDLPDRRLVCLSIRDTGCGMTDAVKTHLFEPFYTTKGKGKGTGLGLSTVFGIIKQSGGDIEVESTAGGGTTFRIYLPYIEVAVQDKDTVKDGYKDNAALARGTETVLLVEDEESLRRLGERLLRLNGYTVISAADGKEALEAAERHGKPVDLLLTDVVMPGMSGRELSMELARRKLIGWTLFMSGYTDDAIVQHGVLDPGIAFIYKPFTVEALSLKLREVLDGPADQAKA
ncbi:MAG: PAS domain S-box protein [Elusimicrobiales bacterium]